MMDIVTIGTVCLPVWGKNKNLFVKRTVVSLSGEVKCVEENTWKLSSQGWELFSIICLSSLNISFNTCSVVNSRICSSISPLKEHEVKFLHRVCWRDTAGRASNFIFWRGGGGSGLVRPSSGACPSHDPSGTWHLCLVITFLQSSQERNHSSHTVCLQHL